MDQKLSKKDQCEIISLKQEAGVVPRIFRRRGADSFDKGAKIWIAKYYNCSKCPKICFHLPTEASMLRKGGL